MLPKLSFPRRGERSEAERGRGLGLAGLFCLVYFSLLLMFSLAVILVCGLLLQALANAPRCFTDAPQILIDAGPSKAKRSEVVCCMYGGSQTCLYAL